jgi:hypothetical protein
MAKLDEILKSKGFSDDDLKILTPQMRDVLESHYGALETERDTLKQYNDMWANKLETEFNPAITKAEQEAAAARLEAATLREQVKIARDYGYLTDQNNPPKPPESNPVPDAFDPKKHNLVTRDDVARFADLEGDAIAMAHDLSAEYAELYPGQSLLSYQNAEGKRGMRALRAEAIAAKRPLDQYVFEKFKFSDKRAERATAQQQAHDAQVAKEAIAKHIQEHGGNPNLTIPAASRVPFMPPKPQQQGGQPWERGTPDQLKASRIDRAAKLEATAKVQ